MNHPEGDGSTYTYGSIIEKYVRKSESGPQSKQSLERRQSSTSGKVCDRVESCLLCYSTSMQRK